MKIRNLLEYPNLIMNENHDSINKVVTGSINNGQYSTLNKIENSLLLDRDVMGLNKLFYGFDYIKKEFIVSNTLYNIYINNSNITNVRSLPAGRRLELNLDTKKKRIIEIENLSSIKPINIKEFDLDLFQTEIDNKLTEYFQSISKLHKGKKVFVCLSGGLDSSIIAYYAKKYFSQITAITFTLTDSENISNYNPRDFTQYESHLSLNNVSNDYKKGLRFAIELDIPFLGVLVEKKINLNILKKVLIYGQDYRDFNVHCAWVNYHLGKSVRNLYPNEEIVFLTGDLMNEFIADYKTVKFENNEYYKLPKVPNSKLNKILINGLECGDREIGIFNYFNITTLQPFSSLVREYLKLPDEVLLRPNVKEYLNSNLIKNESLRSFVNKSKVRAQVGGSDGGVLALFVKNNIQQKNLKSLWEDIFYKIPIIDKNFKTIIEFGQYKS
tara:strand:- start:803 stop:2125 length:1323 start_codon:yes stop_codon:yes gene_type:complete